MITALLLLVRAQPARDWQLEQFFGQEACASSTPCWQGIRPGITTAAEAVDILKKHPWVSRVSDVNVVSYSGGTGLVYWSWSSRYPFTTHPDAGQQGIIIVRDQTVEQIYVMTDIPLGDFWLTLGQPDGGRIDFVNEGRRLRIDDMALFGREALSATARVYADCASTYLDLWRTPVYIWLQNDQAHLFDHVNYDQYLKQMRTGFYHIRSAMC